MVLLLSFTPRIAAAVTNTFVLFPYGRRESKMSGKSRNGQQSYCSNCGQPAAGKFCANCGTALKGAACPACGTALQPGARFCHNCSHRIGGGVTLNSALPWVAVAAAAVVLVVGAVVTFRQPSQAPTALPTAFTSQGTTSAAATPREEADALFDQAMTAFEGGDSATAAFSGQMALNAYDLLGTLDPDAHFHVGLLHQISGDPEFLTQRADSIEALVPSHLFAPLLRHRAGRMAGDTDLMNLGYEQFLQRYPSEVAAGRWEYDVHSRLIAGFKSEAESALGRP